MILQTLITTGASLLFKSLFSVYVSQPYIIAKNKCWIVMVQGPQSCVHKNPRESPGISVTHATPSSSLSFLLHGKEWLPWGTIDSYGHGRKGCPMKCTVLPFSHCSCVLLECLCAVTPNLIIVMATRFPLTLYNISKSIFVSSWSAQYNMQNKYMLSLWHI